jgi:hypothetical protein
MEPLEIVDTYFGREKSESVVFLALGVLGIGLGLLFWWYDQSSLLQGAIAPLLTLGLISGIVGGTIFFRTDAQVAALKQTYQQDSRRFFAEEQIRMHKVNRNWAIYKIIELAIILAAVILLFVAYRQDFWVGFAIAALLMASALIVLDVIGERNSRWYAEHLQPFAENAGRDDA